MVQDDGQIRHGLGKGGQLGQLREAHTNVEGQTHTHQHLSPGPIVGTGQHPLSFTVFDLRMRIPSHSVPDATKPVEAGGLKRLQHGLHAIAQLQIGMANDGRCGPARTIKPGCSSGCQALDKFHLADGAQLHRPIRAVHGPCLYENRRAYVVATIHVGGRFVKKIALIGYALGSEVPEMMMRVADWNFGFQRGFLGQRQPVVSAVGHRGSSVCLDSPLLGPTA